MSENLYVLSVLCQKQQKLYYFKYLTNDFRDMCKNLFWVIQNTLKII